LKLDVELANGPKVSWLRTWFAHENKFGPFALGYHVFGCLFLQKHRFPKELGPIYPKEPCFEPICFGFLYVFLRNLGTFASNNHFPLRKLSQPFLFGKASKKKLVVNRFEP
jgi:hypothetical protein